MALYSSILALTALSNLFIVIFVLTRDFKREANRIFCCYGLSVAVWGAGAFIQSLTLDKSFAIASIGVVHLGAVFIPSTFYHFVLAITENHRRFHRRLSSVAYLLSFIFLILDRLFGLIAHDVEHFFGFYYPVAGPGANYFNAFFILLISYGIYLLWARYKNTSSAIEKNRLKYLFIGMSIALLSSITNILLVLGIKVYPLAPVGVLGYNLFVVYAIVKYHLMDTNVIIRRGLSYFLITGTLAGIFFFSLIMFEKVFRIVVGYQRNLFSGITSAFIISVIFQPFRERIQGLVDRTFFKEEYKRRLALVNLSQRLSTFVDCQELLFTTLKTLKEILSINQGMILLRRDNNHEYRVSVSVGLNPLEWKTILLTGDTNLVRYLRHSKRGIPRQETIENPNPDSELREDFNNLKAELCIPIIYGDKLLGILALGKKTFDKLYNPEEIDILTNLGTEIALSIKSIKLREEMREKFLGTVLSLARAIGTRDPYTWEHCQKVSEYAVKVAERIGLASELIEAIRIAGLLHDIGKIGINDKVLLKPDRLSEEEFAVIKKHPVIGTKILESIEIPLDSRNGVRHHHERLDGYGYPDGTAGDDLSPSAKILAVVDVYNAMTTDRPYRKAINKEEAVRELRMGAGRRFDVNVVKTFLKILEEDEKLQMMH